MRTKLCNEINNKTLNITKTKFSNHNNSRTIVHMDQCCNRCGETFENVFSWYAPRPFPDMNVIPQPNSVINRSVVETNQYCYFYDIHIFVTFW